MNNNGHTGDKDDRNTNGNYTRPNSTNSNFVIDHVNDSNFNHKGDFFSPTDYKNGFLSPTDNKMNNFDTDPSNNIFPPFRVADGDPNRKHMFFLSVITMMLCFFLMGGPSESGDIIVKHPNGINAIEIKDQDNQNAQIISTSKI